MKRKHKRLLAVLGLVAGLGVAVSLVLTAFNDNLVFFHSPSDVAEKRVATGKRFRIGGLVEEGSVKRDGLVTDFVVTDLSNSVAVRYTGMLPDLFREGQGVVANGQLGEDGRFVATEVLAKHDENYMPPEVAEALRKSGQWHEKPGDHANLKPGS
ncbi:MAG TPA: cytochrome c maturation protein CcmE [Ferrovibrio sp.]|uniref:cytochrome c maturation protein CcmE n=1 Tax=Ferrovibrio sp. TaxID=1917215 RepID=UPI002B4B4A5D|nr:cytochrome c maturation protein CcmE [Ferrovibrio sp.]HLT78481.1 cytochrome c maturation protein CcmE [Ferrovibrio sp.]